MGTVAISELIVRDVVSTIEGIGSGGIGPEISTVARGDLGVLQSPAVPYVVVYHEGSEHDEPGREVTNAVSSKIRLGIDIRTDTIGEGATDSHNLIADIHQALLVDTTRGGLAVRTLVERSDISLGVSLGATENFSRISIMVEYRTRDDDLTEAA